MGNTFRDCETQSEVDDRLMDIANTMGVLLRAGMSYEEDADRLRETNPRMSDILDQAADRWDELA